MHDWIMTDDATHQHVRQIGKDTFELIELNAYPPNDLFEVYTDIICLSDYPEAERAMILRFFGYASPIQVLEEYGESANQIIAECVFEHYSSFALESMATGLTKEEAQIFIDQYISKGSGRQ